MPYHDGIYCLYQNAFTYTLTGLLHCDVILYGVLFPSGMFNFKLQFYNRRQNTDEYYTCVAHVVSVKKGKLVQYDQL